MLKHAWLKLDQALSPEQLEMTAAEEDVSVARMEHMEQCIKAAQRTETERLGQQKELCKMAAELAQQLELDEAGPLYLQSESFLGKGVRTDQMEALKQRVHAIEVAPRSSFVIFHLQVSEGRESRFFVIANRFDARGFVVRFHLVQPANLRDVHNRGGAGAAGEALAREGDSAVPERPGAGVRPPARLLRGRARRQPGGVEGARHQPGRARAPAGGG